jgi:hypothetical protein
MSNEETGDTGWGDDAQAPDDTPSDITAPTAPVEKPQRKKRTPAAPAAIAEEPAEAVVVVATNQVEEMRRAKRVKIILEENDAIPPGGQFFGVQGTGYQIQPGKPVDVPEFLLGVIDNAVASKPVFNDDGQVVGYREVPRFPYRVIR